MFFSIIFGITCGGMIVSILGFIHPSWAGADDREIIYESIKGWFVIFIIVLFFCDADSFSQFAWLLSTVMGIGLNFIKVKF